MGATLSKLTLGVLSCSIAFFPLSLHGQLDDKDAGRRSLESKASQSKSSRVAKNVSQVDPRQAPPRFVALERFTDGYTSRIALRAPANAWVKISIRDSAGTELERAAGFLKENEDTYIDLEDSYGGLRNGDSCTVTIRTYYLGADSVDATLEIPTPPQTNIYKTAKPPDTITHIADVSAPWRPSVTLNEPGSIKLTFSNEELKIPRNIRVDYDGTSQNTQDLTKVFEVDLKDFPDGTYRYTLSGQSENDKADLLMGTGPYFLILSTTPTLEGLMKLDLDPQTNAVQISFQLSHKISAGLKFNNQIIVTIDSSGDRPPFTYTGKISLTAQDLLDKLIAKPDSKIADSQNSALQFAVINMSGLHGAQQVIGQFTLQGISGFNTSKLIATISAAKGTVKTDADANQLARKALGLNTQTADKDTADEKAAVSYIVSVLKGNTSNVAKLLSFLKLAGTTAMTFWGVPGNAIAVPKK